MKKREDYEKWKNVREPKKKAQQKETGKENEQTKFLSSY